MLNDSQFIEYLTFPELIDEYKKEKKSLLSSIEERYEREELEIVKCKLEGIKQDQNHRMILNACIFPFAQDDSIQKYGYTFLRASPLRELNVPNTDFLLYHPNLPAKVIFGEAKGQVNDPGRVVDEMKERIDVIGKNSEYIKTRYLKNSNYSNEFVIGVGWPNGNNMMKTVLRRGGQIKIWEIGIDITGGKETLALVTPASEDGLTGKTMLHDKNFSRILTNVATTSEFKSVFVESHPFAKLSLLTLIREDKDGTFSFDDFLEITKREFDYLEEEEIRKIADEILNHAIEIKYIEMREKELTIELEKRRYHILSKKKKADSREIELRKKWIEYTISKDKEQEMDQSLAALQDKFKERRAKNKTILELIKESETVPNTEQKSSKPEE